MNQHQILLAKLTELRNILEDAKATIQWHKLKVFETNLNPSNKLFFRDDSANDLTNQQAKFWMLSANINSFLITSGSKHSNLKKDFAQICTQFYYLGTDIHVY